MKTILATLALTVSLAGFSQNKLSFQAGQKFEIVTETKKKTTMDFMGQSMESNLNSTMTESYDVQSAGPDGAVIEYKVKRLVLDISGGMMGSESFDSEKEGDRKGQMGKLLEKGLKNKYTMTIDPSGTITSVKADDDNPNGKPGKKDEDAMMKMMAGQLGFSMGLPKVGDASIFKLLPAKTLAKGDSWSDTATLNGQKRNTVYTVSALNDDNLAVSYTETIETNTTQEIMGTQATVKNNDNTSGQILIDRKSGLLRQRTYTMESKGTMEGQGMTLPSTGTTTVTVTVNKS